MISKTTVQGTIVSKTMVKKTTVFYQNYLVGLGGSNRFAPEKVIIPH
jgi:hypothetical protein